jgi:hypothetical protein
MPSFLDCSSQPVIRFIIREVFLNIIRHLVPHDRNRVQIRREGQPFTSLMPRSSNSAKKSPKLSSFDPLPIRIISDRRRAQKWRVIIPRCTKCHYESCGSRHHFMQSGLTSPGLLRHGYIGSRPWPTSDQREKACLENTAVEMVDSVVHMRDVEATPFATRWGLPEIVSPQHPCTEHRRRPPGVLLIKITSHRGPSNASSYPLNRVKNWQQGQHKE